jgi:hypothetical protein
MPMNSSQLAALVERAKAKAPPVVSQPPSPPPVPRARQAKPVPPAPTARQTTSQAGTLAATTAAPRSPKSVPALAVPPPLPSPASQPEPAQDQVVAPQVTAADDFPIGWELSKESWHFHRRFFAIFRRPMHRGEYSHLLWQIRRRKAEHLWEDCWRVTLPNGRTLAVRGNGWRLVTILPRNWQPPEVRASLELCPDPSIVESQAGKPFPILVAASQDGH